MDREVYESGQDSVPVNPLQTQSSLAALSYKSVLNIPEALSRSFQHERHQIPQKSFDFENKLLSK